MAINYQLIDQYTTCKYILLIKYLDFVVVLFSRIRPTAISKGMGEIGMLPAY